MEIADGPPPPVVCTLGVKPRDAQRLEWHELAAIALTTEAVDDGVVLTFALDAAASVEDLADREVNCCGSWLDITTDQADGALRVALTTTNDDGVALIREMAGLSAT